MESERPEKNETRQWESAYVCPQCGNAITLKDIGVMERTTGVITCPKCKWSGPVDIGVIEQKPE